MTTLLMLLSTVLLAVSTAAAASPAIPATLVSRSGSRLSARFFERILSREEQQAQGAACQLVTPATVDICYWTGSSKDGKDWLLSGPTDILLSIDLKTREVRYSEQITVRLKPGTTRRAKFTLDPVDLEGLSIPDGTHLARLDDSDPARRQLWAIAQEADRRASAVDPR